MTTVYDSDCVVCRKHRVLPPVAGGSIYEDDLIYVSHAQLWGKETNHYLGHIFIEPKRHIRGLSDLTEGEAQCIGLYTNRVARALIDAEGVEHVYSFVIGDHLPHLHVHLFGRYPGTPREYWGLKLDEWPQAPRGTESEIAKVAERVRSALEKHK
jgi:histidine triad (HIT) family protein